MPFFGKINTLYLTIVLNLQPLAFQRAFFIKKRGKNYEKKNICIIFIMFICMCVW